MPTTQQLRDRLLGKLKELFQLDQPDLDFGFYRIMHAKAKDVQKFIDKDLLQMIADEFGKEDEQQQAVLKGKVDEAIEQAKKYGAPDPENVPAVKEAMAAFSKAAHTANHEADVYDHLYHFFERYYEDGDFISRRYYTRETQDKAAPYAIPYSGEEVKLHWANADQYYIKTTEYFCNYSFDLAKSQEYLGLNYMEKMGLHLSRDSYKVHFNIVDASEGEHGNIKAGDSSKRFFIIHKDKPVEIDEKGGIRVNFEYRPDPEKTGRDNTWREKKNLETVNTVLASLDNLTIENEEHKALAAEYAKLFKIPAPTDKDKKRPVLAKYVNQYTGHNTMDYFIHKDLGG
ncbi:MAG: hypothetical protein PHS63_01510, partial [Desulfoplanes sp.]|nr:hypothetical protein [Desulfoplanes sp.]